MLSADLLQTFSADYSANSAIAQPPRPPEVRCNSFPRPCQIYCSSLRSVIGLPRLLPCYLACSSLISGFCSSLPCFVIGFLQIPPRDGHPCLDSHFRLPRRAEDFHLRDLHHARRTTKSAALINFSPRFFLRSNSELFILI